MVHRYSPEEQVELFWSHVDRSGGENACWPCNYVKDRYGYPVLSRYHVRMQATQYAWLVATGARPAKGLVVMHSCDNPACVNIRHLSVGTKADNSADMVAKGRQRVSRGSLNVNAKLTEDVVRSLRTMENRPRVYLLARQYSISRQAMDAALRGKTWRHV